MDLIELLFAGFMLYLLYKLVFGLIMPVSKAASQMKSKMAEFQRMQNQQHQQPQSPRPEPKPVAKKTSKDDDYIDFEEVK